MYQQRDWDITLLEDWANHHIFLPILVAGHDDVLSQMVVSLECAQMPSPELDTSNKKMHIRGKNAFLQLTLTIFFFFV